MELSIPSYFEIAVPNDPRRSSPPDAKVEVAVRMKPYENLTGIQKVPEAELHVQILNFISLETIQITKQDSTHYCYHYQFLSLYSPKKFLAVIYISS